MQQFHKFITWRLYVAQHDFGRLPAHHQEHTIALGVSGFTVGETQLELQLLLSNGKTRGS